MVSPNTTGQLKLEYNGTELTEGITANILWRENAVALAKIASWNVDAAVFIAKLDTFDTLKVSFRYDSDAWTKYFEGIIEDVNPILTLDAQTVVATAYGQGRCLRNTHCNTSYGKESENPTIDTPQEIWTDLRDNYVQKSFNGAATGYSLGLSYNNGTLPAINHLFNPYRPNINILNETLLLIQAYRAGSTGHHWLVGTDGTLRVKRIDTDIAGWPKWWNTDQAGSTLVEGTDFIEYSFSKRVRSKDFANKIILASDFRKPGYDYWTENQAALWGNDGITNILNDAVTYVVGSKSIKFDMDSPPGTGRAYIPSTEDAAWDFTKCGSEESIPKVNFYFYKDANCNEPSCELRLCTTDHDNDYYYVVFSTWGSDPNGEWIHRSIPIGPYWKTAEESRLFRWVANGAPDWTDINCLAFRITADPATDTEFLIDDLHFAGKIIREAYNSTNRTANDEHQKVVRMSTAVEDTLQASDDSGLAGRLVYAELLRAQTIPVVGTVKLYGIVDILPGQFVHIHAEKTNGSFRIDDDFRVKQVQQEFLGYHEFYTTLSLTDDLVNTFAKGPVEVIDAFHNVMFIDPEAQSLKATGVDPLVPRLSKDYP